MSQLAAPTERFAERETVALAAVAQDINHDEGHATASQIQHDMEARGYTKIASTFALKVLTQREFLRSEAVDTEDSW